MEEVDEDSSLSSLGGGGTMTNVSSIGTLVLLSHLLTSTTSVSVSVSAFAVVCKEKTYSTAGDRSPASSSRLPSPLSAGLRTT